MQLKKIIISLLVFLSFFSGASVVDSYSISGYVFDNFGSGLKGVMVQNDTYTSTTLDDGYYLINGLSNGTYNFKYSKAGFNTGYFKIIINGKDNTNENIALYDTTPPAPVSSPRTSTGNFFINNTWINPEDADLYYIWFRYSDGTLLQNVSGRINYLDLIWQPHYVQQISAQTVDTYGNINPMKIWFNATIPNNNPIQAPIGDKTVTVGNLLTFIVSATDADSDPVTYNTDATKGTLKDGVYSWTPATGDVGTYSWYFSSTDSYGGTAGETVHVTVNPIPTYIPPPPANLVSTQGNFWIQYVWGAGAGNATDSYNVSVNGIWTNGTTSTYSNISVGPHGWSNISVWAYNTSGGGRLSLTPASQNTQVPNNPISISGIQDNYSITEGQILHIDANYSDADGDSGTFADNSEKWDINPSTGEVSWITRQGDEGIYNWKIAAGDDYDSIAIKNFTVIVGNSTPRAQTNLVGTTGNFWVNYTWEKGGNTDSFNISFNDKWINGSIETYINETVGPHGWGNITVYGWNNTLKALGPGVSLNTQVPNNPPIQPHIGTIEIYKGQLLTFSVGATDADSDPITYRTNATIGSFNTSTGIYVWTPGDRDAGMYVWSFNSSDGYGGTDSEIINIIVKNPLDIDLKFIEPYIINDNGTWVKAWRSAEKGHIGKFIGINPVFKNIGNDSLVITGISGTYNNRSEEFYMAANNRSLPLTLAENESKYCPDEISQCRIGFEIDSSGVKNGFFSFTLQMGVTGYNGSNLIFNYTNITTISIPIIPIYRIKRANADIIVVSQGRSTTVTYTLEANSTINLTNVSIYDPLYSSVSGKQNYSVRELEASKPLNISYNYPVTMDNLSRYKCEKESCIINLANFTGYDPVNNVYYNDTDYVEICVNCIAVSSTSSANSGGSSGGGGGHSGGGGGGGGGIPPSEDFKNIERREVREMDILAKSSLAYVFSSTDPVMVVAFESSISENGVPVAVEVLKNRSKNIGVDAPGKLYRYFNIFAGMSGFSTKISNGIVAYRVNNSWLKENDLDPIDIRLYKWDGEWVEKSTEIAESKPNYTYYASMVGNFSSFAIAGIRKPKVELSAPNISVPVDELVNNTTPPSDNLTQIEDLNTSKLEPPSKTLGQSVAIVFVFGIIGIIYYFKRYNRIKRKGGGE